MIDSPSIIVMNTDMPRGPQLSPRSSYIRYVKDCSDSYIQQESERNCDEVIMSPHLNESNEEQILVQEKRRGSRKTDSIKFTQIAKRNKIIEKFKNNLMQYSYIIPHKFKGQLLTIERYLQKGQFVPQNILFNINEKYMISPSNSLLFYWEQLSIIISFISFWVCSLIISFPNTKEINYTSLGCVFITLITIEAIVTLNKEIYKEGQIINTRKQIFRNYLIRSAPFDSISLIIWPLITFDLLSSNDAIQLFAIMQLIILFIRIFKMYDTLVEKLYQRGFGGYFFDLITLVLSIYFFAHIMACFWIMIGQNSSQERMNWIRDNELETSSIWTLYNHAFYWATMTMTTVGYGDITPKNNYEMVFANVAMFLSSCIFAYSMNAIGILLKGFNDVKQNYKKSIVIMNQYMRTNNVNDQIQNKVRNYLKYLIYSQESENIDANKLVNKLSLGLQQELNSDILGRIIKNIKVLTLNFTKPLLYEIQSIVKIVQFSPGEFIQRGDNTEEMHLFYIIKGKVNFVKSQSNQIIYGLNAGETFNQYEFFTGFVDTNIDIISSDFCQLLKLNKNDFYRLIRDSKRDLEIFQSIKDNAMNNGDLIDLNYKCQFCNRGTHLRQNCPLLSYQPNIISKIKKEDRIYFQQQRVDFLRNSYKMNSRVILEEIKMSIQQFMINSLLDQNDIYSRKESKINDFQIDDDQPQKQIEFIGSTNLQIRNTPRKRTTIVQNLGSATNIKQKLQAGTPMRVNQFRIVKELSNQNSTNQSQPLQMQSQQAVQQTSSFRMLDYVYEEKDFSIIELDKLQNYTNYLPHNNFKRMIQVLDFQNQLIKEFNKSSKGEKSFGFTAKIRISKMKNNLLKQSQSILPKS